MEKEKVIVVFDIGKTHKKCFVFSLNFKVLKSVLKEIGDDLNDKMTKVDERVIIEYKDSGEFEAQLRVAGDLLVFQMHS